MRRATNESGSREAAADADGAGGGGGRRGRWRGARRYGDGSKQRFRRRTGCDADQREPDAHRSNADGAAAALDDSGPVAVTDAGDADGSNAQPDQYQHPGLPDPATGSAADRTAVGNPDPTVDPSAERDAELPAHGDPDLPVAHADRLAQLPADDDPDPPGDRLAVGTAV
ncbi:hypothetical protein GCM10009804_65420 [Kribbella hippodromi]|uniref:Uncharacterized protein n=1 Tax=Kribbella hippodromi TaxID=434347 RepID=A0ABN2E8S3_9ACTN